MTPAPRSRRGSIYVVTLVTVAAIVSIILIGTILRSASNAQSSTIETISKQSPELNNAAELAMRTMVDDPAWALTAQSGKVYSGITIDDSTYEATVTDASTDTIPTDDTTNYRVRLASTSDIATNNATFDLVCTKPNYTQQVVDLSAEFYWPLTESAGASTAEELVESHNGAYANTTISGTSYNDEGAPVPTFNNDPQQIAVPWDNKFRQNNGSVAIWIKFTGPTNDFTFYPFLGLNYESGGNPTLNIALYNARVWAYVSDDGTYDLNKLAYSASQVVTPSTWHHIAVTWGSNGLKVYVDGTLVAQNATNTEGTDNAGGLFGGMQPMFMGSGYDLGSPSTPNAGFIGSVAHAVFYDHDLTADQIAAIAEVKPDERTTALVSGSWTYLYDQ